MSKSNNANWESYFALPNPGLVTYFDKVRRGNSEEYRTTFFKGRSLESVLKGWKPQLEEGVSGWPSLLEFENDLAKKVGPLSIQKPLKERLDDIDSYYDSILLESKPISKPAESAVMREWAKFNRLELRGQKRTVDVMKKSTNSGSPYFTKRRAVVDKTIPLDLEIQEPTIVQHLIMSDWLGCAVLGWRGQEGGPTDDDVKQRVVWMFPFSVNINELQVYQPLIEQCQRFDIVPAWVSMESVDKRITNLFDTKGRDDLVVCTDFSKFDQHFNDDMQQCAKTILNALLARGVVSRNWLENVFPIKYKIPLLWDAHKGKSGDEISLFRGSHGMASGSGGTNVDETLAHRALQYEAAISNGAKLNPNSQCLGDDGILTYPGITVEDVVDVYQSHGQECNLDKQYASSQDCVYLRRWHHADYRENGVCVGVYSTCRAIGRLRYLERFMDPDVWSPELVALRQLSIIENCKFHPLKEEFAQFCMKRDKYRLGLDLPGFLDNVSQLAKEATDYMPDFLGYTKTLQGYKPEGILDWWIVKYLKSHK